GEPGEEAARTELQQLKEAARFATPERAAMVVEALLFAAEKPLDLAMLEEATQFSRELLESALASLQSAYAAGSRGVILVDLGGRWQLRTEPQVAMYVRRMLQVKPLRLTRAALETLAIIAYRQPITRPEMEDLRGVDCGAVTKALLERKLIRILGKKDEPGRPLIFGTTKEFLELFNLRDLTQLPTLREFQELSEESRKIVEDEAPRPVAAGKADLDQDLIQVDGRTIRETQDKVYYVLYKPAGCVTTLSDPENRPTIKAYLEEIPERVYPVGRLDYDVEGALIVTNDGDLAFSMMHPRFGVRRTYLAKVHGVPAAEQLERLRRGVRLEDGRARALEA